MSNTQDRSTGAAHAVRLALGCVKAGLALLDRADLEADQETARNGLLDALKLLAGSKAVDDRLLSQ